MQAATAFSLLFRIHSTSSAPAVCLPFKAVLVYNAISLFSWLMLPPALTPAAEMQYWFGNMVWS